MVVLPLCLPELFSLMFRPASFWICLGWSNRLRSPTSAINPAAVTRPMPLILRTSLIPGIWYISSSTKTIISSSCCFFISYSASSILRLVSAARRPSRTPTEFLAASTRRMALFRPSGRSLSFRQRAAMPSTPFCNTFSGVGNSFKTISAPLPSQALNTLLNSGK